MNNTIKCLISKFLTAQVRVTYKIYMHTHDTCILNLKIRLYRGILAIL